MEVFRLRNAAVIEVAKTLDVLMPADSSDILLNVDESSNSLHVFGTEEALQNIREWIVKLDGEPAAMVIRIFALRNRSAEEAARLLNEILSEDRRVGEVSIVADAIANSLLTRATEEDFDYIEDLLEVIDVPQPASIKVFALENSDAAEAGDILSNVWTDVAQFAVDERTNSVIAMGQAEVLAEVEALLMRLDQRQHQEAAPGQLQIRVIWIVGSDENEQVRPIPADLEEVAVELESLGISRPRIAAQMVVNSSEQFSVSGSALLENPCELEVEGFIRSENARPKLEIVIQAEEETEDQIRTLCDLQTSLSVPIGHFVILGVSPIGSRSSAFVVQVTPGPQ